MTQGPMNNHKWGGSELVGDPQGKTMLVSILSRGLTTWMIWGYSHDLGNHHL